MNRIKQVLPPYFLIIFLFATQSCTSSPKPVENKVEESQNKTIDHSSWNKLLGEYVNNNGDVNYKGFISAKKELQNYIAYLAKINPKEYNKKEQLTYWINAYNALTVDVIIRNYPVKSITNIANGKVWDQNLPYKFNNESLTLSEIEKTKLLKELFDARIHFVINCASESCPKLINKAYTVSNIDALMESATKGYINNPSQNKISSTKASLSMIFNWYKSDFDKAVGSVTAFINKYSATKIKSNTKIDYLEYNWNLNSQ